jgi:ABC-type multidrug transport system fused ATPase/permease subunit
MSKTRHFIPRNKPKSAIVFCLAWLVALFVGTLRIGADSLSWPMLSSLLLFIYYVFAVIGFLAAALGFYRRITGKYSNISEKSWSEQVW